MRSSTSSCVSPSSPTKSSNPSVASACGATCRPNSKEGQIRDEELGKRQVLLPRHGARGRREDGTPAKRGRGRRQALTRRGVPSSKRGTGPEHGQGIRRSHALDDSIGDAGVPSLDEIDWVGAHTGRSAAASGSSGIPRLRAMLFALPHGISASSRAGPEAFAAAWMLPSPPTRTKRLVPTLAQTSPNSATSRVSTTSRPGHSARRSETTSKSLRRGRGCVTARLTTRTILPRTAPAVGHACSCVAMSP
jgi:hypothetical protein